MYVCSVHVCVLVPVSVRAWQWQYAHPGCECVSNAEKIAVTNSGSEHRQRLQLMTGAGQQLIHLLSECPGLLAPKLPMVLAVLSLLRSELQWHTIHVGTSPARRVRIGCVCKRVYIVTSR